MINNQTINPKNIRRKFEKLDDETIGSIIKDLDKKETKIADLSRKYSWSKSAIYNIKRQKNYYLNGRCKRHFLKLGNCEVNILVKYIDSYLNTHSFPLFIKNIQSMLEEKCSKSYPAHLIRKVMMQDAGLSYKKISSRPLGYSSDIIKEARTLLWVNFTKNLKPDNLILNIEECTIGRGWRAAYSWSKIGINQEWQNIRVYGSLKVILAIASNGWWFALFTQSNIDSK